jgi:hypothetical protein
LSNRCGSGEPHRRACLECTHDANIARERAIV